MAEPIQHIGALKSLADSFLDVVTFYMATFLPYHTAFKNAAASIVIPLGILWVAVQIFKFPVNKGASAVGGLILVGFCAFLLGNKSNPSQMFNGNVPPAGTAVAEGSYWSFVIPAQIYKLFKSALLDVENGGSSKDSALRLAYDMNTKNVANKWDGTGLQDAYIQYVSSCTSATMKNANATDNIKALGHVGLHGGSGIGYTAADREAIASAVEQFEDTAATYYGGDTSTFAKMISNTVPGMAMQYGTAVADSIRAMWKADDIDDGIAAGKALLAAIPETENPYSKVAVDFPSGFKIESQAFWEQKMSVEGASSTSPSYMDGSTASGGTFKNPAVVTQGTAPQVANTAFYPENCAEAFEMVNMGVAAYRAALMKTPRFKGAQQTYAAVGPLSDLSAVQSANILRAQAAISDNEYTKANAAALQKTGDIADRANDVAASLYGMTQTVGAKIAEWLLQVKMPFFISTVSMMCAGLITAFPLFIIISIFLGPGILVSYIKLIAFCFTTILLNETFLAMGANLIAVSNQMALVYDIGNIAKNNSGLELSSATAEVVIFTSLMVIETIIAKMLIWDDVKGMTGFRPGEGGAAATSLGTAALKVAASVAALPIAAKTRMASLAAKQSTTTLNNQLIRTIAQNGGNISGGIRTLAQAQGRHGGSQGQSGQGGASGASTGSATGVGIKRSPPQAGSGGPDLVPKD